MAARARYGRPGRNLHRRAGAGQLAARRRRGAGRSFGHVPKGERRGSWNRSPPSFPGSFTGTTIELVSPWLVWILVAVLLAIGEILTPGLFFLGPIALAAAAAAAAAALGGGWVIALTVFVVASAASVGFLRPLARRHIRMPFSMRTGAAALVGTTAVVLERVDLNGGRVKIGGEVWSARSFDESQVLEPGTRVQVAEIQGATALVYG